MNSSLFLSKYIVWFGGKRGHYEEKDISDIAVYEHCNVDGHEYNSCESDVWRREYH